MKKKEYKLKKNQIIRNVNNKKYLKVICVDKDYAIMAHTNKKGTKTSFKALFAITPVYTIFNDSDWCYSGNYIYTIIK